MSKSTRKYSEDDLVALIKKKREASGASNESALSSRRQDALDRYLGKPYGDEKRGQSSVVTRECMEAVEWTLPSLMRVFASSDKIAEFIPVGPEDEEGAKQESEYVNRVFTQENNGFYSLYTWIKDALMNPVSYIKAFWDTAEKTTTETYKGLLPQEVAELLQDEELEPISMSEEEMEAATPTGEVQVQVYDVEFRRTTKTGRVVVVPVPQEELSIDTNLTGVSLEDAQYICHTTQKTRSYLMELGYPAEKVSEVPRASTKKNTDGEASHRAQESDNDCSEDDASDTSLELVDLHEAYIYLDYDGDGKAEFRRIVTAGDFVFENEEMDYNPFVSLCSVPLPHEHAGLSWVELVQDIQRVRTTLTRQFLNNLYRSNNPRTVVGRGVNIDDVVNDIPNSPIRAKDVNAIRLEPTQSVVASIIPAFDMLDAMKEARTGVSRGTMGLDADTLSRVTKGAFLGSLEQANQRLEMLARIIAETGVKPLLLKIHKLLLTHQTEVAQAKIAGQWVQVNPQEWKERKDMAVLVGLGTGNKQAQASAIEMVIAHQKELKASGSMLVDDQRMFNAASRLIEVAGLYNPEKYFADPSKEPPQQPKPPSPDEQMVQINTRMVEVQKMAEELKHQREMLAIQEKSLADNRKLQAKVAELEAKLKKDGMDDEFRKQELLIRSEVDLAKSFPSELGDANRQQDEARSLL
jgi:hypothetical protein